MIARTWLFVMGVVVLLLVGCTTARMYEGLDRPDEEIAKVSCSLTQSYYVVGVDVCLILQVDGVSTYPEGFQGYIYGVELLPGAHSMAFRYEERSVVEKTKLSGLLKFVVEAGHTYKLHFDEEDDQWYAWIVDEGTDEVIAGVKP